MRSGGGGQDVGVQLDTAAHRRGIEPVPHRQYVFTIPRLLRPLFARHRTWLGELCRIAARMLVDAYAEALPSARPGLILFVQTFGDLANFNPHVHVLAADGAFLPDGTFVFLPAVPEGLLAEGFRRAVLEFLLRHAAISEDLRAKLLGWRHSGFSVHNQVRVAEHDPEGRKKLAGYMLRAPKSLEKMTYDPATGTVIYRSKMQRAARREAARERCRACHRARRARQDRLGAAHPQGVRGRSVGMSPRRGRGPVFPPGKGPMRVIALIDDPPVMRRILEHLGRWQPEAMERSPPAPPEAWPSNASFALTYHPVPDIA